MRDPCQISISTGGCVTRDCRFERNTTVLGLCLKCQGLEATTTEEERARIDVHVIIFCKTVHRYLHGSRIFLGVWIAELSVSISRTRNMRPVCTKVRQYYNEFDSHSCSFRENHGRRTDCITAKIAALVARAGAWAVRNQVASNHPQARYVSTILAVISARLKTTFSSSSTQTLNAHLAFVSSRFASR
jgi:hypothetical protein